MSSRAGLFDFELNKRSIFDPEVNKQGVLDPDLSTTASASTNTDIVPVTSGQVSGVVRPEWYPSIVSV